MQLRIETLAELKAIRFDKKDTIFCKETEREYYFEESGGSLTPDDLNYVQAVHGANSRYVAMAGSSAGQVEPSEALANSQTGAVDSIASGTAANVAIGCTGAAPVIQGIAARDANTRITLVRAGSGPMTIKNMASATPADSIALPDNEDLTLDARESATFIYVDSVGWLLVSTAKQVTETKFIFNPAATASAGNVYKTFAELYAAFLQKAGEGHRTIEYVDESGSGITIPAGTYAGLFDEVTHVGVYSGESYPWQPVSLTFADGMLVTGACRGLHFENLYVTSSQSSAPIASLNKNAGINGEVFLKNFMYIGSGTYGVFGLYGSNGPTFRMHCIGGGMLDIQGIFLEFTDDSGGQVRVYDIPADAIILNAFKTSVGNTGGNSLAFYFTTPTAAPDGNVSLTQVNFAAGDVSKVYNTYFAPPRGETWYEELSTQKDSSSTTWVEVFSKSFTPKRSDSKILIRAILDIGFYTGDSCYVGARILKDGVPILTADKIAGCGIGTPIFIRGANPIEIEENADSASARIYSVEFRQSAFLGGYGGTSSINLGGAAAGSKSTFYIREG